MDHLVLQDDAGNHQVLRPGQIFKFGRNHAPHNFGIAGDMLMVSREHIQLTVAPDGETIELAILGTNAVAVQHRNPAEPQKDSMLRKGERTQIRAGDSFGLLLIKQRPRRIYTIRRQAQIAGASGSSASASVISPGLGLNPEALEYQRRLQEQRQQREAQMQQRQQAAIQEQQAHELEMRQKQAEHEQSHQSAAYRQHHEQSHAQPYLPQHDQLQPPRDATPFTPSPHKTADAGGGRRPALPGVTGFQDQPPVPRDDDWSLDPYPRGTARKLRPGPGTPEVHRRSWERKTAAPADDSTGAAAPGYGLAQPDRDSDLAGDDAESRKRRHQQLPSEFDSIDDDDDAGGRDFGGVFGDREEAVEGDLERPRKRQKPSSASPTRSSTSSSSSSSHSSASHSFRAAPAHTELLPPGHPGRFRLALPSLSTGDGEFEPGRAVAVLALVLRRFFMSQRGILFAERPADDSSGGQGGLDSGLNSGGMGDGVGYGLGNAANLGMKGSPLRIVLCDRLSRPVLDGPGDRPPDSVVLVRLRELLDWIDPPPEEPQQPNQGTKQNPKHGQHIQHSHSYRRRLDLVAGDLTRLQSSCGLGCRFLCTPCNFRFSPNGGGDPLAAAVNTACAPALHSGGVASLSLDDSGLGGLHGGAHGSSSGIGSYPGLSEQTLQVTQGRTAEPGKAVSVRLVGRPPLVAQEGVAWVIHVMAPSMNSRRADHLDPVSGYPEGVLQLRQSYEAVLQEFVRLAQREGIQVSQSPLAPASSSSASSSSAPESSSSSSSSSSSPKEWNWDDWQPSTPAEARLERLYRDPATWAAIARGAWCPEDQADADRHGGGLQPSTHWTPGSGRGSQGEAVSSPSSSSSSSSSSATSSSSSTSLAPPTKRERQNGASTPQRSAPGSASGKASRSSYQQQVVPKYQHPEKDVYPADDFRKGLLPFVENPKDVPPETVFWEDDLVTVIYDKYRKARVHLLMLPKLRASGGRAVRNLQDLDGRSGISLIQRMHNRALWLSLGLCKQLKVQILFGFHAVPSLDGLHLHIISLDFDSPHLKNKRHWNSFTTEFFLSTDWVLERLKSHGKILLEKERFEQVLKRPLQCHRCNVQVRTIPALKHHIQHCEAG